MGKITDVGWDVRLDEAGREVSRADNLNQLNGVGGRNEKTRASKSAQLKAHARKGERGIDCFLIRGLSITVVSRRKTCLRRFCREVMLIQSRSAGTGKSGTTVGNAITSQAEKVNVWREGEKGRRNRGERKEQYFLLFERGKSKDKRSLFGE